MYSKSIVFIFIIVFSSIKCLAQHSKYDRIFAETSQILLSSNPKKALTNTDYLYQISKNNSERIKANMLKATLLRQYGIRNEAISALELADSLATVENDYNMQARINGFLSTLYRENEIPRIGKIHLQKALYTSKKIVDKNEMNKFQGNLSQEIAYYKIYELKYNEAIIDLKNGKQFFEKAQNIDTNFHLAVNDELIAKNYLILHQVDSAFFYYQKAQKELNQSQSSNSPLKGFIFNGFGNVYTIREDFKKASINYQKAEQIAIASDFFSLKQEVYPSLLEFYKKTNNNKKYIQYNELFLKLKEKEDLNLKKIADELIKTLRQEQFEKQLQYQKSTFFIIGISFLVVMGTLGIYIYRRKLDYKKFKQYINKKDVPSVALIEEVEITQKKDVSREYMSTGTEESILKNIEIFEKSQCYLNKDISLNSVAAELGINHRYLSYVINKHKRKDFASYINELRVNYIVDRLRNNPDYLKYKISYLADQSGFSSHSRFTITFKRITGVAPLVFITYIQKEQNGGQIS